jgi:ethanolamine utilization protein EutN
VKIAKVAGTVVSPISHPLFEGERLLVCDLVDPDGSANGYLIAVDVVNAGVGERVLICDEGTSARQILGITTGPVRSVIVGIVDDIA